MKIKYFNLPAIALLILSQTMPKILMNYNTVHLKETQTGYSVFYKKQLLGNIEIFPPSGEVRLPQSIAPYGELFVVNDIAYKELNQAVQVVVKHWTSHEIVIPDYS